jgi:uncharacterized protein (DUF362 family)/Pyruvate/2-oxoacid:ferredoxin oxidoreductase delta subunit
MNAGKTKIAHIKKNYPYDKKIHVEQVLNLLGGMEKYIRPGNSVLIKPNFVAPFPKATTNFKILEIVIEQIKKCGAEPIIGESSGYEFDTEMTFNALGVYSFAEKNGVKVFNLDRYGFRKVIVNNDFEYLISDIVFDSDAIINLPRLKKHSQTDVTIGLKNLFGLLHKRTRRDIHAVDLNSGIANLNKLIKPALTIVDATTVLERAVFGEEKEYGSIVAGDNLLAVDRFCCKLMGIDPESIDHIKIASNYKPKSEKVWHLLGDPLGREQYVQQKNNLKKIINRKIYKSAYAIDIFLNRFLKNKSIIPWMHYYFGIRPVIKKKLCDSCGKCINACPINAIDHEYKRIKSNCRHLRCLRCLDACPVSAIKISKRKM